MALGKEPKTKAPWPPKPDNDKFYRYPAEYPVGKKSGENFATIAKDNALDTADLIRYNFLTTNPDEVNWYLGNFVRCPEPRPGVPNYSFDRAAYDAKKSTGVIFIPMFGVANPDPANRLGTKLVENFNKTRKYDSASCFRVSYSHVLGAVKQVGGASVPDLSEKGAANPNEFSLLWGSLIQYADAWKKLPEKYRGKGAAGAVASIGLGTLVDAADIWAGKLMPGAVLQTWVNAGDFERVRDGKAPTSYGHSFIFLNYVYKGSAISGLAIADNGFQGRDVLAKGEYGYWVGANLVTKPANKPSP
jgi:hypothetical protein